MRHLPTCTGRLKTLRCRLLRPTASPADTRQARASTRVPMAQRTTTGLAPASAAPNPLFSSGVLGLVDRSRSTRQRRVSLASCTALRWGGGCEATDPQLRAFEQGGQLALHQPAPPPQPQTVLPAHT